MRRTSGMTVPRRGAALAAFALELLLLLAVEPQGRALDRDLPVGHDLQQLPQAVGDDADQEHLHQGAGELGADPLGGQIAEIQPPEPGDDEDQHQDGQGPPAAHESELGLLVGGPQRLILLRVVGPDRLDQRGDRQLGQGQRQDQRERDVQRRDRNVLEVAGDDEQLQDQPLEHDEHDRDGRPQRREAAPGRAVLTVTEHHPGDAGPRLPEGQHHEAVEDHRNPEGQAPIAEGPTELPGPSQQAAPESRETEDQSDAPGQEPCGPVIDRAQPQVRACRRQHEAGGHHREPGPAQRPDHVPDHRTVHGDGTVDDGVHGIRGDDEGDQLGALDQEAAGDDADLRPQAGRVQAVQPHLGVPDQPAGAEGRCETGQEAEDERAGDPPRSGVAPLGLEPSEGRRGVPGDRGDVPDHIHPAPAQRHRPVAEQCAEGAFFGFGRGQRGLARGDLPIELAEQELARLPVAQARQYVADGLPRERFGQRRRRGRGACILRVPRAAGNLGHLRGCRVHGKQQYGEKQRDRTDRLERTDDHSSILVRSLRTVPRLTGLHQSGAQWITAWRM